MASVFSHTYLCSSPSPLQTPKRLPLSHRRSQRSQTPALDLAHVPGLIRVVVPWRRGARRRLPCQRAFKGTPDPDKKKRESRWQRGMTPPMHCTCSPQATTSSSAPLGSYSTSVQWGPAGALKWKNVSMLRLSTRRHTTRPPRDYRGPADTLFRHKQR